MAIVKPTVLTLRREMLRRLDAEKARHWKLRGNHRLGRHYELGYFRGLRHARMFIAGIVAPRVIVVNRKGRRDGKEKSR